MQQASKKSNIQTTTSSHGNTINNFHLTLPSSTPYSSHRYFAILSPNHMSPVGHHSTSRTPSTSPAHSDPDGHTEVDHYFTWLTWWIRTSFFRLRISFMNEISTSNRSVS